MATLREIKKRIKSVRSIAQVTKAMELVAASKMKRAQANALKSRPFAERLEEISKNLSSRIDPELHPLLTKREEVGSALIVLISPSRGLCGPLISTLSKTTLEFADQLKKNGLKVKYLVIEKKGWDSLARLGQEIVAYFEKLGDKPEIGDLRPIIKIVTEGFKRQEFGEVYLSYAQFVSTLTQRPRVAKILPLEISIPAVEGESGYEYLFEPSPDAILEVLLPQYLSLQLYQAYMEALASEHSARMVSMKNATENAEEVKYELTLGYNKSRQAAITREVVEIATGAEASR